MHWRKFFHRHRARIYAISAAGICIVLCGLYYTNLLARAAWYGLQEPHSALLLDRSDAPLAFVIGNFYFGNGAYDAPLAQSAFQKAIAINPSLEYAHYQLARVLFVEGDFNDALAAINAELALYPKYQRSLYIRGLIYAYSNDFNDAAVDFKAFVAWAPYEWAGYNDESWIVSEEGQYAEAQQILQKAFLLVPDAGENPWLWNALGVVDLNLGQYTQAADAFTHASSTAATLTDAAWHRAYPGDDPATSDEGISQFRQAVAANLVKARTSAQ